MPAPPQGRCAKFGVLGVNLSSCVSWRVLWDCRQGGFLLYKTGHMEVPAA